MNCTGVPNCHSLNRQRCTATKHTCGPCLPGGSFVGEDGDANSACFSVSLTTPLALKAMAKANEKDSLCASSADCPPWYSCDRTPKACYLPSKQCLNGCSGFGKCGFVNSFYKSEVAECKGGEESLLQMTPLAGEIQVHGTKLRALAHFPSARLQGGNL